VSRPEGEPVTGAKARSGSRVAGIARWVGQGGRLAGDGGQWRRPAGGERGGGGGSEETEWMRGAEWGRGVTMTDRAHRGVRAQLEETGKAETGQMALFGFTTRSHV